MGDNCEEPRQVCRNKGFNVATKCSVSDKKKIRLCSDMEKECRDTEFSLNNTRQHYSVATKKMSVATTNPCYWEKLCRNKRQPCHDIKHTTSTELCRDKVKLCRDRIQEDSMKICRDMKLQATTRVRRQR